MATLGIRINDDEYKTLKKRAADMNVSMSKLLKSIAINEPLRVIQTADPRIIYQLSNIGNNINQIARAINVANKSNSLSDTSAKHIYAVLCDISDDINGMAMQ